MGCQGGMKLKSFLHKNQHTQRKLLNFEFWINGELSKIGQIEKDSDDFWHRKFTLKLKF